MCFVYKFQCRLENERKNLAGYYGQHRQFCFPLVPPPHSPHSVFTCISNALVQWAMRSTYTVKYSIAYKLSSFFPQSNFRSAHTHLLNTVLNGLQVLRGNTDNISQTWPFLCPGCGDTIATVSNSFLPPPYHPNTHSLTFGLALAEHISAGKAWIWCLGQMPSRFAEQLQWRATSVVGRICFICHRDHVINSFDLCLVYIHSISMSHFCVRAFSWALFTIRKFWS